MKKKMFAKKKTAAYYIEGAEEESFTETSFQDRLLAALYGSVAGRILLRPLVAPWFSKAGGWLLSTRLSALAVSPFVRLNKIDLGDCTRRKFSSFNDFFTRELVPTARPVSAEDAAWVSPCDARLTVYPVEERGSFRIKHTAYTLAELLQNRRLAERFRGGSLWLYRLCVDDYHRYIYPDDAQKSENVRLPGIFHTVNPVANEHYPIYKENTREYCVMRTAHFGTVVMMEVGALLVGKIENSEQERAAVRRGQEKGHFAFGGSTIVLLTEKGRVRPGAEILERSLRGIETRVKLGEQVGTAS